MDSEVPAGWFKSSYSGACGSCLEVNIVGSRVLIRDSKAQARDDYSATSDVILSVSFEEWSCFLSEVLGEVRAEPGNALVASFDEDHSVTVACRRDGAALNFLPMEWASFVAAATRGEFAVPAVATGQALVAS